jgi:hypothetical protein
MIMHQKVALQIGHVLNTIIEEIQGNLAKIVRTSENTHRLQELASSFNLIATAIGQENAVRAMSEQSEKGKVD